VGAVERDEVTGNWRILRNDVFSSPAIIKVIISVRIIWAEHVVCTRAVCFITALVGKHVLEDLDRDGSIILERS
jgi:hypothetical protein